MKKILIVDDHSIVRKGLATLFERQLDLEIVGEAAGGIQAVQMAENLQPDVVIMDISMPECNGIEATRQIKNIQPNSKILILSMHNNEEYVFQALKAGASGYLLKKAAPEELLTAIQDICRGYFYLSPSISKKVVKEFRRISDEALTVSPLNRLTGKEREILQLIAEGKSNRDIAGILFISIKTVETHRLNLMKKLDIHSIADLTRFAIRCGVIEL